MSPGRVLLAVFGVILALLGVVVTVAGGGLLYADGALKGDDGFFSSRSQRFAVASRAIVTESLDLTDLPGGSGRWGDLRIRASGAGAKPVFVGIAERDDLRRYLAGVAHAVLTDVDPDSFEPEYLQRSGRRAPARPAAQGFWAARVQGRGLRTLTWPVAEGDWQIVAMNADASPGVALDASAGVRIPYTLAFGIGFLAGGLVLLVGGILMALRGFRGRRRGPPAPRTYGEELAEGESQGTRISGSGEIVPPPHREE